MEEWRHGEEKMMTCFWADMDDEVSRHVGCRGKIDPFYILPGKIDPVYIIPGQN